MEQPSSQGSRGTHGLDVFKIAGRSISGYLHSFKTSNASQVRIPFTTLLEERLALYLEYSPQVRWYQRGDASQAFAQAHKLEIPLGTPYIVNYVFEGKAHEYLPDFVGTFQDGSLFIAEAGCEEKKQLSQALAKADAAQRLAQMKGGAYWIGTETNLSVRRHNNLLFLHARRQPFSTYEEIAENLLRHWPWGQPHNVHEFLQLLGSRWGEREVEAAFWKLVGDMAADGRLLVDLTETILDRTVPLALLDPQLSPILLDALPSSLDGKRSQDTNSCLSEECFEDVTKTLSLIPGTVFDASELPSEQQRQRFHRNLAAVTEVLAGNTLTPIAKKYGMTVSVLGRLVQRTKQFGQIACVPYATYSRERELHPELQKLLRKLYTHRSRPTMIAVYEDVRVKQLAEQLSKQEGVLVKSPSYRQVQYFLRGIAHERTMVEARSGEKHPERVRTSPLSFVLSVPAPAHICQVDEHTLDLLVVTPDGIPITRRVHAAALICVKTAAILGAILAPDHLSEDDYMRLVKMAIEPKERWTSLYGCKNPWPCFGKPTVIFHDRGKIFTSERATQVLVDRLGITTEQAPPYAPSAKGTVEALFLWMTRKFEHRLPGTTKSTLMDRGAYDSQAAAISTGMTFEVLEKFFIQAIVDGYMQEWNKLRRQTPFALWNAEVEAKGVPQWVGSPDDLKLLLMKAVNRRNLASGRYAIRQGSLSFLGRRYVSPGLLDQMRGREVTIYYDRRDITVIYLFEGGELRGEAYCVEFIAGRRVSIWEANVQRKADTILASQANAKSLENRQEMQKQIQGGKRVLSLEAKRLERQRQLDQQRSEIHPEHVQTTLAEFAREQAANRSQQKKASKLLPPAFPDDTLQEKECQPLPVRKLRSNHDEQFS